MNDELYETEYALEGEQYEDEMYEGESEADYTPSVRELPESEVDELAMELLGISNEQELDQFLGALASRVVKGAKAFAKSGVGKAIGGALRSVAKTALPMAASALGNLVVPGVGGVIGGKLGSMASKLLEAEEAEMMGEEEAEQEAARRYVRWAAGTIRNAARAPRGVAPHRVARSAAIASARRYAPALITDRRVSPWRGRRGPGWGTPSWTVSNDWSGPAWSEPEPTHRCTCGQDHNRDWDPESHEEETSARPSPGSSGRWIRRGNDLVLLGGARQQ